MNSTGEFFTLETLGVFYTKAAEAGGMEYNYNQGNDKWCSAAGPNLNSLVELYRIKPAPPIVRWVLQFDNGTTGSQVFYTERDANIFKKGMSSTFPNAKVIKLIKEQT